MEYTYRQRKYYESKRKCPKCGSSDFAETQIEFIKDDEKNARFFDKKNKTFCRICGWSGVIDELKSWQKIFKRRE